MRQVDIESRPDWPSIAMSVACPTCFAPIGTPCIERSGATPRTRVDFHVPRKQCSQSAWELKRIEEIDEHIEEDLDKIVAVLTSAKSATLTLVTKGDSMPATIKVGGTATALFQEWSGPNGTGTVLPNAGTVAFTSSNPAVATTDPATGMSTGVADGTVTITGTDPANNLTASDTLTVIAATAQSATIVLTAN